MRRNKILGAFICFIVFSISGACQSQSQAELLRDQGIAAAKQQNWELAFDYLHKAYKLAKHDPSILKALGVAHAKAGHHVPAMFWLKAYLLSDPRSADEPKVVNEISTLEREAREKENNFYEVALHKAKQLKNSEAFGGLASAEAEAGHIQSALELVTDDSGRDVLWMDFAGFSKWVGDIHRAREALSHIQSNNLGNQVSHYCNGSADPHRWDGLSRQQLEGHFLACSMNFFGPDSCPVIDLPLVRQALQSIQDSALRAEQITAYQDLLGEWDKARSGMTKLNMWLGCAEMVEKYEIEDTESEMKPENLSRASFADPSRVPRVIAKIGTRIGVGIARFRSLEARLSQ